MLNSAPPAYIDTINNVEAKLTKMRRLVANSETIGATQSVVEGVPTCGGIVELAKKHSVEMPITESIYSIIQKQKTVKEAIAALMTRELKAE